MKVNKDLLLILKSSGIADTEPDLGTKLMNSFLNVLFEGGTLPAKIICMGTGIFLTTEGSTVGEILDEFVKNGVEILSCGTCLEYYGRTDKLIIGNSTNMKDTVGAMLGYKKVLSP
ncbi:MAG: sulfurtransferase-like selenium metabolism protein YedF [Candidatus Zixiibacteriota bacterium]|nr:MAG: sulfurtransferase-like selenium metabolism protein YedF [candidate division Zixibacteria bacterium]